MRHPHNLLGRILALPLDKSSRLVGMLVSSILVLSTSAQARVEEPLQYTKTQSFRAALRYLRVDHGYNIIEKDSETGYLLFEYQHRDMEPSTGSIEVIQRDDEVALVVQLPKMPSYHEHHLIQGLLKKLRTDYGEPPKRPSAPKKEPEERTPKNQDPPKSSPPEGKQPESPAPHRNP